MPAPLVLAAGQLVKRQLARRLAKVALVFLPVVVVGLFTVGLMVLMVFSGAQPNQSLLGGGNGCMTVVPAAASTMPGLNAEQLANAQTIVAVGREAKVPAYGWVIAVATALQESTLRNLNHGDRDSLGLFQQRAGWGTAQQRTDPATAARMFYEGGHNGAHGLLQIPGWTSMSLTVAAQAVQHSAFPSAYARWQDQAVQIVSNPAVLSAVCADAAAFTGDGSPGANAVVAGLRYVGTPYSWGGGGPQGPTLGFGPGAHTAGFDCSSLVQYVWAQAGVTLPRVTDAQAAATAHLPPGGPLRAGDLLFFHAPSDPPGVYHHVGIYDGKGNMLHAPETGKTVELVHNVFSDPYFSSQFALATRPGAPTVQAAGTHP